MENVCSLCMYTISEYASLPMYMYVIIVRAQKLELQTGLSPNMFVILMLNNYRHTCIHYNHLTEPLIILLLAELQIPSTSLLDEPKPEHSCPVCAELLTEPFLTNCGHLVCGACRDQLLTRNKKDCPVCRKTNVLSDARLDKRFQREVNSLKVRCQHHDQGCEWVGEVRDLQKHLDPERGKCSYVAAMMEQHQQSTCEQYGFNINRKCNFNIFFLMV